MAILQIMVNEISLDWLEAEYVYQTKPVISNAPKEWSIADIDDLDFFTAKVKPDSKATKEKKAKMKTQVKAMKGMIK